MKLIIGEITQMVNRIKCPYCDKRLSSESYLARHIKTIHKDKKQK